MIGGRLVTDEGYGRTRDRAPWTDGLNMSSAATRPLFLLLLLNLAGTVSGCTIAAAAAGATTDGSTLLFHADDCLNCDFRLARVPPAAASEPARVLRFRETYPREVSTRAPTYSAVNLDDQLDPPLLTAWSSAEWEANATLGFLEALDPAIATALGIDLVDGRTYGTLEGLYSIANTEQVAIVESTSACAPLLTSLARPHVPLGGGAAATRTDGALWDISALTKAALARCASARCTVDMMGYLAVRDGFYGGHGDPSEVATYGETLLVADPNELWVFHVTPLPPSIAVATGVGTADGAVEAVEQERGFSAVWAAQRVPDAHFVLVANRFIIREIVEVAADEGSDATRARRSEACRHSSNLFEVAAYLTRAMPDSKPFEALPPSRRGVRRDASGLRVVDWLLTFGGDDHIEVAPYTNDRLWRGLSLFAPDRQWQWPPPTPLATDVYPLSTTPSRPLTRSDFFRLARDVYRGAGPLDLTRGLASGPYGDPSRYDVPSAFSPPGAGGSFPRAISMFRTSYSHVTELRARAPRPADGASPAAGTADVTGRRVGARIWAAQGAPHAAVFVPLHLLPAAIDGMAPGGADPQSLALARGAVAPLPYSLTCGSLHRADLFKGQQPPVSAFEGQQHPVPATSSAFWLTVLVNNYARAAGYDYAWPAIEGAQADAEEASSVAADAAEDAATAAPSRYEAARLLAAADFEAARLSMLAWRRLLTTLFTTLHDGYQVVPTGSTTIQVTKLFYPQWWLERVAYYGPKFYPCYGPNCDLHTISTAATTASPAGAPPPPRLHDAAAATAPHAASWDIASAAGVADSGAGVVAGLVDAGAELGSGAGTGSGMSWQIVTVLALGGALAVFASGVAVGLTVAHRHAQLPMRLPGANAKSAALRAGTQVATDDGPWVTAYEAIGDAGAPARGCSRVSW